MIPTRRELCPSRLPTKSLLLHWMPGLRQSPTAVDSNEGVGPTQREFSAPSRGNVEIVSGSCPHDPPTDLLDCLECTDGVLFWCPQDSDATPRSIQDVSAESLERDFNQPNTAVMGPNRRLVLVGSGASQHQPSPCPSLMVTQTPFCQMRLD